VIKARDGILYPSCSNNFNSINYAFLSYFVDQKITMEVVRKLSFEEFTEQQAHSTGFYFGVIDKGKVVWMELI
jgi:hypothetical protein